MAATAVTTKMAAGINYTYVTDSSADWASVPNSTYFYDKTDKLPHYKDSTGTILEVFAASIYTADGSINATGATRTVNINGSNLVFSDLAAGTNYFNINFDDGTNGSNITSSKSSVIFGVGTSGTGFQMTITAAGVNMGGYYNLPNGSIPTLNQIIYASSSGNLAFTSIKTINSNSIIGSGNISVGTVTSVAALTLGTTGTDLSSTVATGTTTPVITLNVPTASATNRGALSAADWTTFNNKQGALTLTTTGTSGAATLVGNTLNVPQYSGAVAAYDYGTTTAMATFNFLT